MRRRPTAAEGLDQQYAGLQPTPRDLDVVALVGERRGLRRYNLEIRIDAALIAVLGQLQGVPVRLDRIVEQLFLRIVGAQAEVVEREFGMQAETRGLEVGVGRLRSLLRSSNAAANAAQRSTS